MSSEHGKQIFSALAGAVVALVFSYLTMGLTVNERLARLETKMDMIMEEHRAERMDRTAIRD